MKFTQLQESIYAKNPEDPMDPEVLVSGYGRMNLKTLERSVARDLKDLAERAARGEWENVNYALEKSPLKSKLDAISSTYEELENIRKRGGKNSRGISKR